MTIQNGPEREPLKKFPLVINQFSRPRGQRLAAALLAASLVLPAGAAAEEKVCERVLDDPAGSVIQIPCMPLETMGDQPVFMSGPVTDQALIPGSLVYQPPKVFRTIGPPCDPKSKKQKIIIIHVGDLHGNFDLVDDKYSRIRAYYKRGKKVNPYTLFINGGDDHEKGSVAEQLSQGQAVIEVAAAMGFDVRTLGNHDFAWGEKHALEYSRDAQALVLSANTRYLGSDASAFGAQDYGVLKVGCLKLGFFGMVSSPWNELDEAYEGVYFPDFLNSYSYNSIARSIVEAHRGEVDLLIMVSHLKTGDNVRLVKAVPGIDLVLGAHSHDGPGFIDAGGVPVVLPHFYADGANRINIMVDLATRKILKFKNTAVPIKDLGGVDRETHNAIAAIVARYVPDAEKPVAYLQKPLDAPIMAQIAARAVLLRHKADAALLDPARVNINHLPEPGPLTLQNFQNMYTIERQKPYTQGITSFYMAEVNGADLTAMRSQLTGWAYSGPAAPDSWDVYRLVLQKGPALNPGLFFPAGVTLRNVTPLAEAWETLAAYAADRTAAGFYFDTDKELH